MKKKLILILSMVSLIVVVFALSVSASNYIDFTNFNFDKTATIGFSVVTNFSDGFESSVEEEFGIIEFSDSSGIYIYGFVNVEWFHNYFESQNVVSVESLQTAAEKLVADGVVSDSSMSVSYYLQCNTEEFYAVYQSYLEEINTPTYEDGKVDGVEEFKKSAEYESALLSERVQGRAEGKLLYIESEEYTVALEEEYEKGLEDATSEGEKDAADIVAISFGVSFLGILAILCWAFFGKKKKGHYKWT